jgi:hypothetical protein
MFTEPLLTPVFDPRTFSRWALGTFFPNETNWRGAQKCPVYDSKFGSGCSNFPDFSGSGNTISYVYPDGLGWPYANDYSGPAYAAQAFQSYPAQEEIHNAGVLMEGALWDVYDAVRTARGDSVSAQAAISKLVLEAVRHLPKGSLDTNRLSPVTFRGLAQWIVDLSPDSEFGLSGSEQAAVASALTARGLYGGASLPSSWAVVGTGSVASPGLRVEDNPSTLKGWLADMGGDPTLVTQGISTGLNGQLDPGDLVAIWFDIGNSSAITAGGISLTVSTPDSDAVQILDENTNIGATNPGVTQIMYGKVYGSTTVAALNPTVPAGTSYFRTNPYYADGPHTAIWVKVSASAAHGRTIKFHLDLQPSNGPASALDFPARIN